MGRTDGQVRDGRSEGVKAAKEAERAIDGEMKKWSKCFVESDRKKDADEEIELEWILLGFQPIKWRQSRATEKKLSFHFRPL